MMLSQLLRENSSLLRKRSSRSFSSSARMSLSRIPSMAVGCVRLFARTSRVRNKPCCVVKTGSSVQTICVDFNVNSKCAAGLVQWFI
jgi:hypothetical protein